MMTLSGDLMSVFRSTHGFTTGPPHMTGWWRRGREWIDPRVTQGFWGRGVQSFKGNKGSLRIWFLLPGFFPRPASHDARDIGFSEGSSPSLTSRICWTWSSVMGNRRRDGVTLPSVAWDLTSFSVCGAASENDWDRDHGWYGCSPLKQGLVNVPFWVYWTSPYSSHYRPYT